MIRVSDHLAAELSDLNTEQLAAVLHDGDAVLSAGPGSGKTRTLVARAAYLLEADLSIFRGLACLTYTNAAADEIVRRVSAIGAHAGRRLACSTVHAFCRNEILIAYSGLTGSQPPSAGSVMGESGQRKLLQWCFDELGIADLDPKYRTATSNRIRRAIACKEDLATFDQREVAAAHLYEAELVNRDKTDFEAMVVEALRIVTTFPAVRDLLSAKFPHLLVDEYQDMGGVLHQLVVTLHDIAGISVFAVGDGDQSVFGFSGADPRYLNELREREDFTDFPLTTNYRSGQDIIAAAEAALGIARGRKAREGAPPGNLEITGVEGGLDEHANAAVEIVAGAINAGVKYERVAILYPARGQVLDRLLAALDASKIPFLHERDTRLPPGSVSNFVQHCASRTIANMRIRESQAEVVAELTRSTHAPRTMDLAYRLERLRRDSEMSPPSTRLTLARTLQATLDPPDVGYDPEGSATDWLDRLVTNLELDVIASRHPDEDNSAAIDTLCRVVEEDELCLIDIARFAVVAGKVVLTTYHSAKGREFHTVVLPGLLKGIVPMQVKSAGGWRHPSPKEMEEPRRSLYVAITRAEHDVQLIVGPGYFTPYGRWISDGPSPFVIDMAATLQKNTG
ncbi:ATP-dependent helicase [Mycolicibacterium komossense]|uniref:DNA 3'-5' helicase n=1 Tax=Mycolicibacterium komossense TaxID=1779 RepID=A0ABT3CHY4_9MYCO|nr:ATP-dependent helicase [Mycolicibacterium komossense]MCV7229069.1 ATP-dependent helicase [Mycolicibacterium komossense]